MFGLFSPYHNSRRFGRTELMFNPKIAMVPSWCSPPVGPENRLRDTKYIYIILYGVPDRHATKSCNEV